MSKSKTSAIGRTRKLYTTRDKTADALITQLVASFPNEFDRILVAEMVTAAYRMGQEGASTGDLKLLNAVMKELRYAFKVFRPYRNVRKVATFGSARVSSRYPAYKDAKVFGKLMANAGWMVITGAASGIMKAGHEGAGREASIGLNIRLPFEQETNWVIADDEKLIHCKYFFTRKLLFIKESHATILFPGGFGTLDEGFESLTLVQTGKSDPRPIVFVDSKRRHFWKPLLRFFDKQLIADKMISRSDCSIYQLVHSPQEAVQHILNFYSTYHSLRYVRDHLVIRLQHELSEEAIERLRKEFRDMLTTGTIIQGAALSQEADDPKLLALPRLIMRYNRQSFGRLIQLIHRINELGHKSSKL